MSKMKRTERLALLRRLRGEVVPTTPNAIKWARRKAASLAEERRINHLLERRLPKC